MERKQFELQQREETKAKIDLFRAEGLTTEEACAKVGINKSTYYGWASGRGFKGKNKGENPAKNVSPKHVRFQFESAPKDAQFPLVILMGSPAEVNAALDRLTEITRK